MNILIVDDDEDDRDLFCDAVSVVDPQINCIMARNGEEALSGLKSDHFPRPDLIFLDLNMPRVNGVQCLREIKSHTALSTIPVVIYSTSKRKEDKDATKNLGAIYFISKPSSLRELCDEIAIAINIINVAS
jgi:DNA-binding response OmpR family regulator